MVKMLHKYILNLFRYKLFISFRNTKKMENLTKIEQVNTTHPFDLD